MIIRSINNRLLFSLTLFVALSLGLSGFALDQAFRNSVETSLKEKLKAHFYTLLADSDAEASELLMPETLQDPLFNQIESGLFAIIYSEEHKEIWRSPSAITLTAPPHQSATVGSFQFSAPSAKNDFYSLSFGIIWELENGEERQYQIQLLQNATPVINEIKEFRASLWQWFGAIAVILICIQGALMRWGLTPLRSLAQELKAIESGQQDQLQGDYPSELENVSQNLNLLIENERRQRQRYRDTLADLAHSLKTPLAILRGLISNPSAGSEQRNGFDEQITRMDEIVSHQLQRASSKATNHNHPLSMKPVDISELSDKLLRTLNKVYADKQIQSQNLMNEGSSLRADERDLMEVLGNLLDNAFKACCRKVQINSCHLNNILEITIEDDGEGIPEAQRENVLQRGSRADTQHPGQGIGLTVAQDILNSYQAQLLIGDSILGGAKITIQFPQQGPN